MTSATAQSLSPIELAWVRAQTPENLSVTTVAMVCEGPLDPGCIKSRIEDRLLSEERFRQRMGHSHLPLARPRWQEHERFQLSDHFSYSAGATRSSTDLADVVSQLGSQPLNDELPLWQIHLVDHEKGGSVLIFRLHAAVADSKAAHRQDVPTEDLELRAVISLDLRRPGDPLTGTRAALAIFDGPARPQHLCERPITQFLWWPALTGDTALGITLVTYGGQVQFGVSCDEALDTDATALVADMASAATEP